MSRKKTRQLSQAAVKRSPLDRPDHTTLIVRYEGRKNEHDPWMPQQTSPALPEADVWELYQKLVKSILETGENYVRHPHVVRVDVYETVLAEGPVTAPAERRGITDVDMLVLDEVIDAEVIEP